LNITEILYIKNKSVLYKSVIGVTYKIDTLIAALAELLNLGFQVKLVAGMVGESQLRTPKAAYSTCSV